MSRLNGLSLEPSAAESQPPILINLFQETVEKVPKVIELSQLPLEELQILQALKEGGESGAKTIGERVHLSRSSILSHSKKLVDLKYVVQKEIKTAKTGIKPTYIFSLTDEFPVEIIDEAVEYKKKKKNKVSDSVLESLFLSNSLDKDSSIELDVLFTRLKERATALPLKVQQVLKIVPDTGITSIGAAAILGCDSTTAYKHLQYLLDSGWLTREIAASQGKGRSGYAYFHSSGINSELINALFIDVTPTSLSLFGLNPPEIHNKVDTSQENKEAVMSEEAFQEQSVAHAFDASVGSEKLEQAVDKLDELMALIDQVDKVEQELRKLMGSKAEKLIARIKSRIS
ncbi:hypothetical protein [Nostoc sp.]|uniref:hypothetical protein n=1 Tax=Nostoc sp. TaxID=1180 RepID=UPI002FF63E12